MGGRVGVAWAMGIERKMAAGEVNMYMMRWRRRGLEEMAKLEESHGGVSGG